MQDQSTATKPYQNLSDKWAWALAVVPLLVFISILIFGEESFIVTSVTLGSTIAFLALDLAELKRNNLNDPNEKSSQKLLILLGIFLVPVYLFLRAAKTNKRYGYALLWCGLILLWIILSFTDLSQPSVSCSSQEVKDTVIQIAMDEVSQRSGVSKEVLSARMSISVENIRSQGRDEATGACYCAATLLVTPNDGQPSEGEITYDVEFIEDQPGEFYVTVEGL